MALLDRVTARIVRAAKIGYINFGVEPIYAWQGNFPLMLTSTGDPILDANTFLGASNVIDITDISEDQASGGITKIVFSAEGLAAQAMKQIVADGRDWRLRVVEIWQAFIMDDEESLHPEIVKLVSGVMVSVKTTRGPGEISTLTISVGNDTRLAGDGGVRLTDIPRFLSTDTFADKLILMANGKWNSSVNSAAPGSTMGSVPNRVDARFFHQQ